MWGILFIVLLGSLLHFSFGFSGDWKPLGVISAVNESVWEHLKLVFWPAALWTLVEYFTLRRTHKDKRPNFVLAKAAGAALMPLIILAIFYSYTAAAGESIFAVDLASFMIAVIAGQLISYKLWRFLDLPAAWEWLGIFVFIIIAALFAAFTFFPPHAGLFRDAPTGGYGILD
jgi:hypothetical protein